MARHAIVIVNPMQEAQLQGQWPGLYAAEAGDLHEGDEVLFRRAPHLDLPGYFASARVKGIDPVGSDVVLRFTPLAYFHQVIEPEAVPRRLAVVRRLGERDFAAIAGAGGRLGEAGVPLAGFAEPVAPFTPEDDAGAPDGGKLRRKRKAGRRSAPPEPD